MTTGTIHSLASDLHLVEGHHPANVWQDPDIPTVALYRTGRRLYLLDTGVGLAQRRAISELAHRYEEVCDEVVLLNSHGHLDHLGNNDVLAELGRGRSVRHFLPRGARSALDFETFFTAMYQRGLPYFDYASGLDVPGEAVASLLRTLGAPDSLTGSQVSDLGAAVSRLGIWPALGGFLPSVVVDILLRTYPPVFPNVESMVDYEELGPAAQIDIAGTSWTGWTFTDDEGRPEVHVLESGGHSSGGVVFFLPEHGFLMLADETTAAPIWRDSNPARTVDTARKALAMIDGGVLRVVCAGHRPMLPARGGQARTALEDVIASATEFSAAVEDVLRRHPGGMCVDALYEQLVTEAQPGSTIAQLVRLQFPVFSTFLKLTLLNHCLLIGLPEAPDPDGRPSFSWDARR